MYSATVNWIRVYENLLRTDETQDRKHTSAPKRIPSGTENIFADDNYLSKPLMGLNVEMYLPTTIDFNSE